MIVLTPDIRLVLLEADPRQVLRDAEDGERMAERRGRQRVVRMG
jgi:hypothetical protein